MRDFHIADFLRKLKTNTVGKKLMVKNAPLFFDLAKRHQVIFSNTVDADQIAKKAGWEGVSWDDFCKQLTAGPICLRASVITSKVQPSEVALEHERAKLALLHEFNRCFRRYIDGPR